MEFKFLNVSPTSTGGDFTKTQVLKGNYKSWIDFRKDGNSNFYILPTEIEKYLPLIKTGAINLYLYYCLHSRNETGESWYSTESLARKLNATTRSINNWNKDLIDLGLIERKSQDGFSSTVTYLLPISNYFIFVKDSFSKVLSGINSEVDGEIKAVLHLYQWRKGKLDESEFDSPYNLICLVLERKYTYKNEILSVKKYILINDEEINTFKLKTSNKNIDSSYMYLFDTPMNIYKETILHQGVLIPIKYNLKSSDPKKILSILDEISNNLNNLNIKNFKKIS